MDNPSFAHKRLLVVDDERVQQTLVNRAVTPMGYLVDTAANLHEATAHLLVHSYDAVVLDLSLGESEGISLFRALRDARSDPTLIFLSRLDERVITASLRLASGMGLRVAGMLQKPASPHMLRALLREAPPRQAQRIEPEQRAPSIAELSDALQRGLIVPHFQPQISLCDGQVVGVEALARWPGESGDEYATRSVCAAGGAIRTDHPPDLSDHAGLA